jgi:hypothetical protein
MPNLLFTTETYTVRKGRRWYSDCNLQKEYHTRKENKEKRNNMVNK